MAHYKVVFVKIDGNEEEDLGLHYLAADNREDAEAEAMQLPVPTRANFLKIARDGLVEFQIGLSL